MADRIADNADAHRRRTEAQGAPAPGRRDRAGARRRGRPADAAREASRKPLGDDVSVQIPPVDDGKFVNRLTGKAGDAKALPKADAQGDRRRRQAEPTKADAAPSAAPTAAPRRRRRPTADRRADAADADAERRRAEPAPKVGAEAGAERRRQRREAERRRRRRLRRAAPAPRPPRRAAPATPAAAAPPRSGRRAKAEGFVVQLAAFADDKGANALANKLKKARLRRLHRAGRDQRAARCGACASAATRRGPRRTPRATKLKGEGYSGIVAPAK